jgi:demethylmenaquinone methyltransferase / 2-methoxy-6-polyprenyl-1,4-benzoquinol methylase
MAKAVEERIWLAEGTQKRAAVRNMFSDLAPTYDLANSLLSLSLHHRWRSQAVAMLDMRLGDRALDVCCGTGDFLAPLRRAIGSSGTAVGVDFCSPMLAKAAEKYGSVASLALGDACRLPLANEVFDGVTVGWGIRNVPDIDEAHREIFRVLRPGGRFVSLDMARPKNGVVRAVSEFIFSTVVPRLGKLFGHGQAYTYLPESTQRFWSRERLAASMESAGLIDIRYRDLMFGNICVHYGRRPDEAIADSTGVTRP